MATTKPTGKTAAAAAERKRKAAQRAAAARERVKASKVGSQAQGFMDFVREQGVVGLAVGLAIGTSATVLVKSIVDNLVNPLVGALLPGSSNLSDKYICIGKEAGQCVNQLGWGAVVSNIISFMAVAAVVYFAVKMLKLDKLDKKKDK